MNEIRQYVDKNLLMDGFALGSNIARDLYNDTYTLYNYRNNIDLFLRIKEKVDKEFDRYQQYLNNNDHDKIKQSVTFYLEKIASKYQTYIDGNLFVIKIPTFEFKYKHLSKKYEESEVTINISITGSDQFGFRTKSNVNIRSSTDRSRYQHPHCGAFVCFGTSKPLVDNLLKVYRYDVVLERFMLNLLVNINPSDFLVSIDNFFTKSQLEYKPKCARCGRTAIPRNGHTDNDGNTYHKKCWERHNEEVEDKLELVSAQEDDIF